MITSTSSRTCEDWSRRALCVMAIVESSTINTIPCSLHEQKESGVWKSTSPFIVEQFLALNTLQIREHVSKNVTRLWSHSINWLQKKKWFFMSSCMLSACSVTNTASKASSLLKLSAMLMTTNHLHWPSCQSIVLAINLVCMIFICTLNKCLTNLVSPQQTPIASSSFASWA
jgi:hypothetical protein